jgi:hypothetical protein
VRFGLPVLIALPRGAEAPDDHPLSPVWVASAEAAAALTPRFRICARTDRPKPR